MGYAFVPQEHDSFFLRAVQYESLSQPEETIEMMCLQCHAKRRASARLRPIILSRLKGQ